MPFRAEKPFISRLDLTFTIFFKYEFILRTSSTKLLDQLVISFQVNAQHYKSFTRPKRFLCCTPKSNTLEMLFNAVLLLAAASLGPLGIDARTISEGRRVVNERSITTSVSRPSPGFKRSNAITSTGNIASMSKRSLRYNKRSAAYLLGKIPNVAQTGTFANGSSSVLTSLELGQEYATSITIGTQTFEVVVDTGSSDTVRTLSLELPFVNSRKHL